MKTIKENGVKYYIFTPEEYNGVKYNLTFRWKLFNYLFKSMSHFLDDSVQEIHFVERKKVKE